MDGGRAKLTMLALPCGSGLGAGFELWKHATSLSNSDDGRATVTIFSDEPKVMWFEGVAGETVGGDAAGDAPRPSHNMSPTCTASPHPHPFMVCAND